MKNGHIKNLWKKDINDKGIKFGNHESKEDEEDETLDKNEKTKSLKLKLANQKCFSCKNFDIILENVNMILILRLKRK